MNDDGATAARFGFLSPGARRHAGGASQME